MTSTLAEVGNSSMPSVADDPRWPRIVDRDKTADGHFWYSVPTTGVYCRSSCPSRTANPRNVQLHDTLEGSFSFRARRDGRDWEGAASLCSLQDGEHGGRATEMEQSAAVG